MLGLIIAIAKAVYEAIPKDICIEISKDDEGGYEINMSTNTTKNGLSKDISGAFANVINRAGETVFGAYDSDNPEKASIITRNCMLAGIGGIAARYVFRYLEMGLETHLAIVKAKGLAEAEVAKANGLADVIIKLYKVDPTLVRIYEIHAMSSLSANAQTEICKYIFDEEDEEV